MKQVYKQLSRWLIAVFCTAALLYLILSPEPKLRLIDDNAREIAVFDLGEKKQFFIKFIHSVNQTPVIEGYEIKNNQIFLISCQYYGFGAGVATTVEKGWQMKYLDDGSMLITDINRAIPNLSYIVGTVSDHILIIDDTKISLTKLCGQNRTVRFVFR